MGLSDWVAETADRMRSEGVGPGLRRGGYEFYRGSWRVVGSRLPLGTNIYDRSWDVVVVLDACRVDVLRAVADDYVSRSRRLDPLGREPLPGVDGQDVRA